MTTNKELVTLLLDVQKALAWVKQGDIAQIPGGTVYTVTLGMVMVDELKKRVDAALLADLKEDIMNQGQSEREFRRSTMTKADETMIRMLALLVRCAVIGLRILSKANNGAMSSSVNSVKRKADQLEQDINYLISTGGR